MKKTVIVSNKPQAPSLTVYPINDRIQCQVAWVMSSPLKNGGMSPSLTNLSPGLLSTIGGAVYLGYGLKGPGVKLIPYIGVDDEKEDSTLLAKLEPRSYD